MRPIVFAPALFIAAGTASAATIVVHPDGSGDVPDLRAAVELALSGDVIELGAGVFGGLENLDLTVGGKDLVFRSISGRDATMIDATILEDAEEGDGRTPHFCFALDPGSTTRIEGITMAYAFHGRAPGEGDGGTIRAAGASLTLVDCRIEGLIHRNGAARGGGVFIEGGFLRAVDCEFVRNKAGTYGGAIYARGGRVEIERCAFSGNGACAYGGAVCMDDGSLIDCTFDPGGAMYCEYTSGNHVIVGGNARILRCRFNGGWNVDSGGLFTGSSSNVDVGSCVFEDCSADVFGGAGFLYGNVTIRNTIFRRNWGAWMGGTDLFCAGRVRLEHCTFVGSSAQRSSITAGRLCGGQSGSVTADHCVWVGCRPMATIEIQETGTLVLQNSILAFGGAADYPITPVRCVGTPTALTVRCTDIFGNHGGDWTDCLAGREGADGNLCADPLFCSLENEDFSLQADSPCAAGNTGGCGLIGVLGAWCGPASVERSSWGSIKALFR